MPVNKSSSGLQNSYFSPKFTYFSQFYIYIGLNMKHLKWQHKLFLIALVISIVPVLLISSNMIEITEETLTNNVNEELSNAANNLSDDINDYLIKAYEKIAIIENSIEDDNLGSNEKISLLVSGMRDINEVLTASLVFQNPDDTYSQALKIEKETGEPISQTAKDSLDSYMISCYPGLANLEKDGRKFGNARYLNEPDKWVTYTYRTVSLEGAPKGYLIAVLDLSQLSDRIRNDSFLASGNIYIVDPDTNYILNRPAVTGSENTILSDAVEMLTTSSRASGVTNFKRNNETIVASFAFPQNIDWAVITEMNRDEAYKPVSRMKQVMLMWIAGGLILAGLGVVLFTKMIGRPIHILANKADEISKGNFDITIDYKPKDSLGVLGNSLLSMSKSLKESFLKIENQNRQLEEYNRTLEDKVKERTQELKQTNDDLQKAYLQVLELNKEKNEFLGIAAHDLKNPLAAIKGFGKIIFEEHEMDREEIEEYADNIVSSSERMFSIITSLLDINRIEEGKVAVKFDEVWLTKAIREIVFMNMENAQKKDINVAFESIDENMTIMNDREIISQIVDNLVSNAVKFSPHGKNVYVTIKQSEESATVSVKDEGPGFSDKDKEKLFNKFARLSARPTGGENSTGLGLSIVKKLAEMIGADIKVESEKDNGAEFIVTLPL